MLRPRRYASDVAAELVEGLRNGTILLDSLPAMADVMREYTRAAERYATYAAWLYYATLLGVLSAFGFWLTTGDLRRDWLPIIAATAWGSMGLLVAIVHSVRERRKLKLLQDLENWENLADRHRSPLASFTGSSQAKHRK